MIKTKCPSCSSINYRSPSKVRERNYCDSKCYDSDKSEELIARGAEHSFKPGRPEIPGRIEALKKISNTNHYAWKGESVGYRGLHQWVMRQKGKPAACSKCPKKDTRPRMIQWANIDGKYRRDINDFIALCVSCHKNHDINLSKSTLDAPSANQ